MEGRSLHSSGTIGPFHHKNKGLRAMEDHEERYCRSFVKRSAMKLEYLVGTIREMEESIRRCCAETIDLTSDRFVKMISMDASFIPKLFFRFSSVRLDLLLLENQLPFFVIKKLRHLAFPYLSDYDGLLELSYNYFGHFNMQSIQALPNVKMEHFTDLLRTFQIPPLEKRPKRGNEQNDLLYTATQLHEAGVKFKVVTSECRFDIKFEKGVSKIPHLKLDDWTKVVTRNIMALE